MHALCAFGGDGLGERSLRCTIVAEEELQCPRGLVPECRRRGLAFFQHLSGEGNESLRFLFIDDTGTHFLDSLGIFLFCPLGLVGIRDESRRTGIYILRFLHVIDKVLHEIGQHTAVGIAGIDGFDTTEIAVVAHAPAHALLVVLSGIDLQRVTLLTGLEQCAGIDVLHHVAVDALRHMVSRGFPVTDVLDIVAQEHVGAHGEQTVLSRQPASMVSLCGSEHLREHLLALQQLLPCRIVPFVSEITADLEIFIEPAEIAHHLIVLLLPCHLHDKGGRVGIGLSVPTVFVVGDAAVGILFPEVVDGFELFALGLLLCRLHAHEVIVVRRFLGQASQ